MPLFLKKFVLGPLQNNTYLLADEQSRSAVVIDPSFEIDKLLTEINRLDLKLRSIWITHAHFDHIAGVERLSRAFSSSVEIALHPADLPLWKKGGGSDELGFTIETGKEPTIMLDLQNVLKVGENEIQVFYTPGHTPGHVTFYCKSLNAAFCGDLIFFHGIGRTDLPGGDYDQLIQSIRTQILTLPPLTRLLSGHGPETTVTEESNKNPFL